MQFSGLGTPDRLPSWDKTVTIYQGIYFVPFFINAVGDISRRRGLFTVAWLNAILISVCAIHAPRVVRFDPPHAGEGDVKKWLWMESESPKHKKKIGTELNEKTRRFDASVD